jgi:hypothetical protein
MKSNNIKDVFFYDNSSEIDFRLFCQYQDEFVCIDCTTKRVNLNCQREQGESFLIWVKNVTT